MTDKKKDHGSIDEGPLKKGGINRDFHIPTRPPDPPPMKPEIQPPVPAQSLNAAEGNPGPSARFSRAVPVVTVELLSSDIELLYSVLGSLRDTHNVVFLDYGKRDALADLRAFFDRIRQAE